MHYMQYNIYFRKENWERFKDEENKSGLINKLLSEHYTGAKVTVTSVFVAEDGEKVVKVAPRLDKPMEPHRESPLGRVAQKYCRHGADPRFCKFKPPNGPCK